MVIGGLDIGRMGRLGSFTPQSSHCPTQPGDRDGYHHHGESLGKFISLRVYTAFHQSIYSMSGEHFSMCLMQGVYSEPPKLMMLRQISKLRVSLQ